MKKRKTNNAAGKLSTAPPRYPHDERIRTGSRCIHGCGIAMSPPLPVDDEIFFTGFLLKSCEHTQSRLLLHVLASYSLF